MEKSIVVIFLLASVLSSNFAKQLNGNGEVTAYNLNVTMNMAGIDHEKIKVKLVEDGAIIVEWDKTSNCGTAELIPQNIDWRFGHVTQPAICRRRFSLPADIHPDTVQSNLTNNGILTVSANASIRASIGQIPINIVGHGEVTGYNLTFTMNMSGIAPEKIKVKLVEDGGIIVEWEKSFIKGLSFQNCRQRISLPAGIRPEMIQSNLTADGKLRVTASASTRIIPPFGPIPINIFRQEDADQQK